MEQWTWKLFQRRQSVQRTYKQYTQTARKMRRMKHAILLAKDHHHPGRVIGMVELGISGTGSSAAADDAATDNDVESPLSSTAAGCRSSISKRATIGVLCVDAAYRQQGVATDLVERCVSIVSNPEGAWGGEYDSIYAEVEPGNANALAFFESMGFARQEDCIQQVTVRRRNRAETKPHLLLAKPLNITVPTTVHRRQG